MEDATEKSKIGNQIPEKSPFSEKGRNVHMILKFIRHGLRTPSGELTDYGRVITQQKAREAKSEIGLFNVVGAMGSDSGPIGSTGMQRSLETARIYASEIDADKRLQTRGSPILGYDTRVIPIPFDWDKFYNDKLPANFVTLSDEEKNKSSKVAQAATLNHFMSLQTPEAISCRKEIAGSFARVIDHYMKTIKGIKSGTKALLPQGTHGGRMEPFLKEVLIRRTADGKEIHGFEQIEDIGGEFDSSEAFNVEVATDDNGSLQKLKVTFDNKDRPQDEMYLDPEKLQELKEFYTDLHSFEKREGYLLEIFSSEAEMFRRMEEIRKSSPNEAHGFVVKKTSQLGFYYQIGDSEISTELPQGIDNSWHSHPDTSISEIVFNENDLPDDTPKELKRAAEKIVQIYGEIDDVSPEKISLMDIINIVSHGREKDLISLPGGLLELDFQKSEKESPIQQYAVELDNEWRKLVGQIKQQLLVRKITRRLTENNIRELRIKMVLQYYDSAISKFKNLLNGIGYERMEKDNYLEILQKMGLSHNFQKI